MLILTNDTQTFNVPIFRSPFVDDTLVIRLHNKTTNEDVLIHPDSCEIHTTYVTITADLSNLYGGEWEYRLVNTDEDGYIIVSSQGTMYVNQLARFTDANGERTYSTRESVRGVCPPCPPCPNAYYINVTADLEMANVAGSCDSVEENATIYIGCVPNNGYRFVMWDDDNTDNPRRVVADGNKTFTAVCEVVPEPEPTNTHTISITFDQHATSVGGGVYEEGKVIKIAMVADAGYKFVSWSDGDTSNPRSVVVDADKNYTAVIERVEAGGNKFVTIDRNDAIDIFCPQTEGTIGSVLPWRVRKTKPFVVVDFDASYNQQYSGGSTDDAMFVINNYQDGNQWQGLIMLSDDDSRNIIKYNVNQHSVDFGESVQYTTGSETFVSIEGDADGVLYETYNEGFSDIFDDDVVSSMTNKFFKDAGFFWGVDYMFVTNTNYWESCINPDVYFLSLKSNSSCLYSADVADVVYYKNTGNEFIIEFAKDNGGEHYNVVQWHIGINDSYVYCVLNNWTDNIDSVWWCNDYYANNNTAFLGTDGEVKYCRDYGYAMPWNMTHESTQLSYVPTDGTMFGFTIQENEPKRLDIEVAYSEKANIYGNLNNVCQPYSNNIEDFIVGNKYINQTTGVNFYEFVGDRLPMVTNNTYRLSKYEVKNVMPDITMLQDNFMSDARLGDYSWLFDKLPNISTIENNVLYNADISTFEPSVGQWSQLTTIGALFLSFSMVERVDFTNLTNLTTVRSHLCYSCANLVYANISELKNITDYDNLLWFNGCYNLRDIIFDGSVDQYQNQLGSLGHFYYKDACTLHVAPEYLQTYIDMYGGEWMNIVAIE